MIYLPPEILTIIFQELAYTDLINLRKTCKRFKEIVDNFRIKELIVFNVKYINKCNSWYFTNEPIDYRHCLNLNTRLRFFNNKTFCFKFIEKIKIISPASSPCFKFNSFNRFSRLVCLDLDLICLDRENERINSKELKYLSINSHSPIHQLEIEAPKLVKFKYNHHITDIKFNHPNSITLLETVKYDKMILSFVNLEYLSVLVGHQIDKKLLEFLKNLRVLNLVASCEQKYNQYFCSFFHQMKLLVDNMMNEKTRQNRINFKLLIYGLEINSLQEFSNLNFSQNFTPNFIQNLVHLHQTNSAILNETDWLTELHYNQAIEPNFYNNYRNVQKCICKVQVDQQIFTNFLRNQPNLCELEIVKSNLNSEFYNNLPQISSNLRILKVIEFKCLDINIENFQQFHLLKELSLNQQFRIANSPINLFERLKFFSRLHFVNNIASIDVSKLDQKFFLLSYVEWSEDIDRKDLIKIRDVRLVFEEMKEALTNLESRVRI